MATYENNVKRNDPRFEDVRRFCRMVDMQPSEDNVLLLERAIGRLRDKLHEDALAITKKRLNAVGEVVTDGLFAEEAA